MTMILARLGLAEPTTRPARGRHRAGGRASYVRPRRGGRYLAGGVR